MEAFGKDHPNTLASISNLADSLHQQAKYAEAGAIQRQADGKSEQTILLTQHSSSKLDSAANRKRKAEPKGHRDLCRSTRIERNSSIDLAFCYRSVANQTET